MYSSEDFSEIDKSNFKCFKFPSGNIYFGETVTINDKNEIIPNPAEITDEEVQKTLKLVRHGNGVELFPETPNQKNEMKYEGQWVLDKKEGKGLIHFEDGSTYEGEFKNDKFDGVGKFVWRIGHVYIGNWKEGRMEGNGEFKHKDGHILNGTYINNYIYDLGLKIFINPFLNKEDLEIYKNNCMINYHNFSLK